MTLAHAPLRALLLGGLLTCLGAGVAAAHGGVYKGPPPEPPAGPLPPSPAPAPVPPTATPPPGPSSPPGAPSSPTGTPPAYSQDKEKPDLSGWGPWWGFNRDPYLDLKRSLHRELVVTGSDDFFLGRGERAQIPDREEPGQRELQGRVVPALLEALRTERSDDVQTAALMALAKIGGGGSHGDAILERAIRPFLKADSQEVSETATIALGVLGRESSAFLLADLLLDSPAGRSAVDRSEVGDRTRAFAAYALGLIAADSKRRDVRRFAVGKLCAAFDADDAAIHDVRAACTIALGLIPLRIAEAERARPQAEESPPPSASRQAQIGWLLAWFRDAEIEPRIRGQMPVALARLLPRVGEPLRSEVIAALTGALAEHSREPREVREGVAAALGRIGDSDRDPLDASIREALFRSAQSGNQPERYLAWMSLARVASQRGAGPEPEAALGEVRAYLLTHLARSRTLQRPWAALALAEMERRERRAHRPPSVDVQLAVRQALVGAVSPEEVGGLCIAAGLLRDLEAKPHILRKIELLRDDAARGHAAVALGLIGTPDVVPPLRELVAASKYRPVLLREAAIGLGLVGDEAVVPELVGMLGEAGALSSQAAIALALGHIGDLRSIEPLLQALRDPALTDRARAFAVVSLGLVGDRSPLPWNAAIARDVGYTSGLASLHDAQGSGILDIL